MSHGQYPDQRQVCHIPERSSQGNCGYNHVWPWHQLSDMAENVLPWAVNDIRNYYSLQLDGLLGLAHLVHL